MIIVFICRKRHDNIYNAEIPMDPSRVERFSVTPCVLFKKQGAKPFYIRQGVVTC